MSENVISIHYGREMRCLINRIKTIGLNSDGILYGGIVRDDIIGNHYRNSFIERGLDFSKYWDISYDIDTKYRTIIPNDIDIFFKKQNSSAIFLDKVSKFIRTFGGSTMSVSIENTFNNIDYTNCTSFLKHRKVYLHLVIGQTLTKRGITLKLKIDLIEIDYSTSQIINHDIEPPFYNVDFMCNIFITEKVNSSFTTRISSCTGTKLDSMVFSKKTQITARIIDDIINFRTQFINKLTYFNAEYINCYRILKMIDRGYASWEITNIPFCFLNVSEIDYTIEDKCCICLDDINIDEENKDKFAEEHPRIIMLTTNDKKPNHLHEACFMNYLKIEHKTRYINEQTGKIECRCPFRNLFNFKYCYKNIEYI